MSASWARQTDFGAVAATGRRPRYTTDRMLDLLPATTRGLAETTGMSVHHTRLRMRRMLRGGIVEELRFGLTVVWVTPGDQPFLHDVI